MESYELKKSEETGEFETEKKTELDAYLDSPEGIKSEEVEPEEISTPDILAGTEIVPGVIKTSGQEEPVQIEVSGSEDEITKDENPAASMNEEELPAEKNDDNQPEDNGTTDNNPHSAIQQEIHDEQEFFQHIQDQDLGEEELSREETDELAQPVEDYSSYNKEQLVSALRTIMREMTPEDIRPHAEAIKASFYKIKNAEIQEQKQAFITAGNDKDSFVPEEDSVENDLKELLKDYRNQRAEINKRQDAQKEENYLKKIAIIEEIKTLVHSEESLNATFQEFNDLQERWRKIGQVPQNKVKDLWENYHYNVELFYDFVKINRELRDLDLRRNMDLKIELCKKAEDLAANIADAQVSFRELQKLHESWREIGPVPRDGKQELWERFKAATSVVNKRYQQYFEHERAAQREQLQKKTELCELAEIYSGFVSDNPREWNDITDKVIALQEEWKKTGYGPRKENARIWERFRAANDAFFQSKRNFWNASKDNLNKNLVFKLEICEQAEKLRDSEDWKATTDKLITLQKKWKEIGPVPRKQSEIVWKRFRTACDEFFNRKVQHFSGISGDQDENYKAKKALLSEIESFNPTDNSKANIEILKGFQERWAEIGFVPFRKKEELQSRYHSLMDGHFDKLKLDDQDVQIYKFKSKIEHLASIPGGWGKINAERDRCVQHLKQLETDIITLGNNVGFFGSSKGAQSLIDGVNAQIGKIKNQIDYLKNKIKIIDNQDEKVQ